MMRAKTSMPVFRDMITFAKRFGAPELLQEGVIQAVADEGGLIEAAKDQLRPWLSNKGRKKDGSLSTMGPSSAKCTRPPTTASTLLRGGARPRKPSSNLSHA